MDTKDEFVRKMHSELDQWNTKIDALATKVDQAEEHVHIKLHKKIEALRGKRDKAHNQLKELEQASEKAWNDMKAGVEIAWEDMNLGIETVWDAISETIDSAKSRFK